jgi:hypothetical protein
MTLRNVIQRFRSGSGEVGHVLGPSLLAGGMDDPTALVALASLDGSSLVSGDEYFSVEILAKYRPRENRFLRQLLPAEALNAPITGELLDALTVAGSAESSPDEEAGGRRYKITENGQRALHATYAELPVTVNSLWRDAEDALEMVQGAYEHGDASPGTLDAAASWARIAAGALEALAAKEAAGEPVWEER